MRTDYDMPLTTIWIGGTDKVWDHFVQEFVRIPDSPDHRCHPPLEIKLEIIHRFFEDGEDIKSIMNQKKDLSRVILNASETVDTVSNNAKLVVKIRDLELENDILRQTIEVLKKIRASSIKL